ncbi:unnamed protein product, partial [marine sediment metagenome]
VSWELHCTSLGDVIITVTPDGTDVASGRLLSELGNITPDSIIVCQRYIIELWGPEYDPVNNPDGWNLMSLMVEPEDPAIEVVLESIEENVVSVWYYDAQTETWLSSTPDGGAWVGDLPTMEDGKGFWIQMTQNDLLAVSGTEVVPPEPGPNLPPSYQLYAGWNLVGFSSLTPMPADYYFFAPYYNEVLKCIWLFGSGPWGQYILCEIEMLDLEPGKGYWVWVAVDHEVVVPWNN